mgnify:CR=1 FL=1
MTMRFTIFGSSGYAREVAEIIVACDHTLLGFIGPVEADQKLPLPLLGSDDEFAVLKREHNITHCHIAVGDTSIRRRIADNVGEEAEYIVIQHPTAVVAGASIAEGTIVYPGAIILRDCNIGRHSLINSAATLGHDVTLGAFCNVGPGANIAGGVTIGDNTTIGIGAVIRENIVLGSDVVIGAGAVVVSDVPDGVTSYGNPARIR